MTSAGSRKYELRGRRHFKATDDLLRQSLGIVGVPNPQVRELIKRQGTDLRQCARMTPDRGEPQSGSHVIERGGSDGFSRNS
jgi:hypothetical protein